MHWLVYKIQIVFSFIEGLHSIINRPILTINNKYTYLNYVIFSSQLIIHLEYTSPI